MVIAEYSALQRKSTGRIFFVDDLSRLRLSIGNYDLQQRKLKGDYKIIRKMRKNAAGQNYRKR